MQRHCNHSAECCNNHEHACKTVARPTYHRRVHSATAIWHSNQHDCHYCNSTQYADDKQWLATIRATAKATAAQWRVDHHSRHDTTTTVTATTAVVDDSIPPANDIVPAAVLTPPLPRIATALAHQPPATFSRPLTRSSSIAIGTASAVDHAAAAVFINYRSAVLPFDGNGTSAVARILIEAQRVINNVSALQAANPAWQTREMLGPYKVHSLWFGTNGLQYDVTHQNQLYDMVKAVFIAKCQQLNIHVSLTDTPFNKLWLLQTMPGASQQATHRDYCDAGVTSMMMYLTDVHETTLFSTLPFVPPFHANCHAMHYERQNMRSQPARAGDIAIFDGRTIHSGPGNRTDSNRWVLYADMVPQILQRQSGFNADASAVHAVVEMRRKPQVYTKKFINKWVKQRGWQYLLNM